MIKTNLERGDLEIRNPDAPVYLAFDGGGTKTEMAVIQGEGQILLRRHFTSSNPNAVGMEASLRVFREGIHETLQQYPSLRTVWIGCAGMGASDNRENALKELKKEYPSLQIEVASDIENCLLAVPEAKAIIGICGTGSVIYVKTESGKHRMGGWGYLFGDELSGFHLGKDAIRAVLAQYDGLGPETELTKLLEEKVGGNLWTNLKKLYTENRSVISSLAPCVFEAYRQGDAAAMQILQENAAAFGAMVTAASHQYDITDQIHLFGGLCGQREILEEVLRPHVPEGMQIEFSNYPPLLGACVGALKLGEVTFCRERVEKNFAVS